MSAPAGELYVGSYHQAARRAAAALATPDTRIVIVSAFYGLIDLDEKVLYYDKRLGTEGAITAECLRGQAQQLGLADTTEVIVLAPAAYANLAAQVWPNAQLALRGTRGIGDQLARFAALSTGRASLADFIDTPVAAAATAVPGERPEPSNHSGRRRRRDSSAGSSRTSATPQPHGTGPTGRAGGRRLPATTQWSPT